MIEGKKKFSVPKIVGIIQSVTKIVGLTDLTAIG